MQWLPDVLTLIQTLNGRFHSKFSREEVSRLSIGQLCQQNADSIPGMNGQVDSFLYAWNIIAKRNGMKIISNAKFIVLKPKALILARSAPFSVNL